MFKIVFGLGNITVFINILPSIHPVNSKYVSAKKKKKSNSFIYSIQRYDGVYSLLIIYYTLHGPTFNP